MNAQLAGLYDRFRANATRAQSIVSEAGESRVAARPGPGSWSAAECLVHLTLSSEMYFGPWRTSLAEARARNLLENGPFKMEFIGSVFYRALKPPAKLRTKAPAILRPTVVTSDVLPRFLASQEQLLAILTESNGLAIDRIKIASPFASIIRFNIWSSFCLIEIHKQRHLWQAELADGLSE
jgi:hypothetical protein